MAQTPKQPATLVIQTFGGIHATTRAINEVLVEQGKKPIHYTTVSKWHNRQGNVPHRWHRPIIKAAQRIGVTITLDDLEYMRA